MKPETLAAALTVVIDAIATRLPSGNSPLMLLDIAKDIERISNDDPTGPARDVLADTVARLRNAWPRVETP